MLKVVLEVSFGPPVVLEMVGVRLTSIDVLRVEVLVNEVLDNVPEKHTCTWC